jgi:L-ascorbate metabolism protein UlaG (beta-lactamase superfamily)
MKLKYFSHSACQFTTDSGKKILIDPFLDGNPTSPVKSKDVEADYIILTHAHNDHLGDAMKIAKKGKVLFICVNELADYLSEQGFEAHNMHIGGGYNFDFGRVKFTIAHHGSQTPDGKYAGEPAGVILKADGKTVYHTGDTGLFLDMKLISEMNGPIDYMLLPIGDNFTMNITDAVRAAELVRPKVAIPIHYNTFPVIKADPNEFKQKVEAVGINSRVLDYGEEIQL